MSFELWGLTDPFEFFFILPANFVGYGVLAVHALILLAVFARTFPSYAKLKRYQWPVFIALTLVTPILITSLRLRFPGAAAPPGVPVEPVGPTLSLLGYTPILLTAGFAGIGPAALVGLIAGIARAGWETSHVTTVVETALAATLMAWLMRQDYRGLAARFARIPIVAALLTALVLWLISYFSFFANSNALGLIGLDFVTTEWTASALPRFGEMGLAGVMGAIAAYALPSAWAPTFGNRPPPYSTSLNRRLLFTLLPISFFGLLILISANLAIANEVATTFIVEQMGRNAQSVANTVPYFIQTGQSLLLTLSADPHIQNPDDATLDIWLQDQMRSMAFFTSLALYDQNQEIVAAYPPGEGLALGHTTEEEAAIKLGIPQTVTIDPADPQAGGVAVSFIVPVLDANGNLSGTLIGRSEIESNPLLKPAIEQMRSLAEINGAGFIVDDRNTIIFHTDRAQLTQTWLAAEQPDERLTTNQAGLAYRNRNPNNTRILVYHLPVNGYPWTVVIVMPNEVVLAQATQITAPLIVILVLLGTGGAAVVLYVTSQITRPLETLAQATAGIAQGELDRPVKVAGEDEVGRLGVAF
ncbi:MAG TPA: cache domain-containing protein, partial [Anaerolineales bacterium]|nr:cache domain-containing protein [Anaerolineales bacterium]